MPDTLYDQYQKSVGRSPCYDDGVASPELPPELPARLIAFYLPQFHAIPENDRWWGEGFTEWANVAKALPLFPGHYQPRMPGALGFYDLTSPDVLRKQAMLAHRYGIHGFCFHYYWFGGRRLLERPLNNLLADSSIDLPFCINWANENWTRRWDGREREVLIAQSHSPEDDIAFAESIRPLFDDPRYIRIANRPLLCLYRPGLLPDAHATTDRWRGYFQKHGEEPLILMVQGINHDPQPFGIDGAVGFPPWGIPGQLRWQHLSTVFDPTFSGDVFPYADVAGAALECWPNGFRFFPGVCPSWDNTARSAGRASIVTDSSPELYGEWLEAAIRQVRNRNATEERFVFINAWNEWAEGAYLEPDRHFGFAYLVETARALNRVAATPEAKYDGPLAQARRFEVPPLWLHRVRRGARVAARAANALANALASI